ncbi:transposase [Streptomyces sp. Ncost-T10-10d]|uniref:transposase n=1 Tax=Streptomyces sp. Ncost-T10-10d TaxID=1839774 RepID=UPI00081D7A1B|nr:transposase [Streptomyces sp. Ncost-T10-10d]SCF81376.1 Putative transposase of IS4/5 family [Streptomyces sp. Ncost-T10-10d]
MDDDLWAIDRAVVTGLAGQGSGTRPAAGRLRTQGILHVPHNDIAWQLLPPEPGFGSGQICRRRRDVRGRV